MSERLVVLDAEGSIFCLISPASAKKALARREVVTTDDPRVLRLHPDVEKRTVAGPGLSPEARRRRYLRAAA